jgi:hypothetical protein
VQKERNRSKSPDLRATDGLELRKTMHSKYRGAKKGYDFKARLLPELLL